MIHYWNDGHLLALRDVPVLGKRRKPPPPRGYAAEGALPSHRKSPLDKRGLLSGSWGGRI